MTPTEGVYEFHHGRERCYATGGRVGKVTVRLAVDPGLVSGREVAWVVTFAAFAGFGAIAIDVGSRIGHALAAWLLLGAIR